MRFAVAAASAQAPPVEEAVRLFDAGRAAMADKQTARACELYTRSQQLDPQLGTLLHLADCQELLGHTASAYRDFIAAQAIAAERNRTGQPEPRERVAARRAAELLPRVPTLRLILPPSAAGVVLSLDGQRLDAGAFHDPQPIDPGTHTLTAEASLTSYWTHTLAVEPAGRHELTVPEPPPAEAVAEARALQPRAASATLASPAPPVVTPVAVAHDTPGSTQRIVAYSVAGAGLVGAGVAVYLGLAARHYLNQRDTLCARGGCTLSGSRYDDTVRVDEKARDFATAFNWTVALSAAAIGGAAILYFTAPTADERPVALSVGPGHVVVSGRF